MKKVVMLNLKKYKYSTNMINVQMWKMYKCEKCTNVKIKWPKIKIYLVIYFFYSPQKRWSISEYNISKKLELN